MPGATSPFRTHGFGCRGPLYLECPPPQGGVEDSKFRFRHATAHRPHAIPLRLPRSYHYSAHCLTLSRRTARGSIDSRPLTAACFQSMSDSRDTAINVGLHALKSGWPPYTATASKPSSATGGGSHSSPTCNSNNVTQASRGRCNNGQASSISRDCCACRQEYPVPLHDMPV